MTYINITKFVLINYHEKDHNMIETPRLKNVVIFIQTNLSFVLSGKIITLLLQKRSKFFYIGERFIRALSSSFSVLAL